MSIDTTRKQQQLANEIVQQVEKLKDAVNALVLLNTEVGNLGGAGTFFDDYDVQADPTLAHLDTTAISNVLGSGVAINTFITDNFHWTNIEAVTR